MSIHQNSSSLLEVFLSGNRLWSANRRYFQQGKIRKFCHHVFEACRDARMVLSAHCFLARLIHPKDSNQFFMKLPFQIFKPFDSAPSGNFVNFVTSDHSAGFRAERAAHLSHGNSPIGPCKTAKGNIRSKTVKHFQGLCCIASSSAMLHACKRISVLKPRKVSSNRPDDIALPRHQNLGLQGWKSETKIIILHPYLSQSALTRTLPMPH